MTERTLILLKPDAVQRTISGEIISRFEKAGLKIIGMKMVWCDKAHAMKHYTEDITIRRGEKVRANLLETITSGPVIAMCIEGIEAIEVVRKMVGSTEPKGAAPGTIRGDYAHMSYAHADKVSRSLPNLIHASSSKEDANSEVALWFKPEELHSYKTVHDIFMI
mgnify:CR=1 FL=1